jgi:hypothetical protein
VAIGEPRRDSKAFFTTLLPLLKGVKMIIVDDVHRPPEDGIAEYLKEAFHLRRYNIHSVCDNTMIALLLDQGADQKVEFLPAYLKKCLET